MWGAVIGDIVGSIYEWSNIKSKDFELFDEECTFTDDSVMTIAIDKAILDCNSDYSKLHDLVIDNMVSIGRNYEFCGYGGRFYHWIMTDNHEPYNSFGNGSAMRVSGVGLIAKDIEEVKKISRIVTEVSHNHEEGIKGAEAVSIAIFLARNNKSIEEIKEYIIDNYYKIDFKLDDIRSNYVFDVTCQGSVPQSLEAFFESTSFEDAIRNAISIGGDSDTIAAITGSIAEAYYGIPEDIKVKASNYLDDKLLKIINKFYLEYRN